MKKLYIILFSCIFLLCGYTDGNSQRQSFKKRQKKIRQNNRRISSFRGRKTGVFKNKRYNYIAVGVNAFNYFGDLAPLSRTASTDLGLTRSGFGVTFGHRFGPRYTLRGSLNYGTIRGDDFDSADPTDSDARFRYVRNLQFRNRITELAVTGMFDLFKNESSYISRVQFTPYIFFGAAVFIHNPQALVPEGLGLPDEGSWVDLEPLGTEGQYSNLDVDDANFGIDTYSLFQIAIPVGIGIRYRLNQILDLSLEAGVRYTWTDYLDDVSASYVDPGVFQGSDAALARALSDRSQEATAAVSGDQRQMISNVSDRFVTVVGRDGETYTRLTGYGFEGRDHIRGNSNDNDVYIVTTLKVAYIIGGQLRKAKFR